MARIKIRIWCTACRRHLEPQEWDGHIHGSFYWTVEKTREGILKRTILYLRRLI